MMSRCVVVWLLGLVSVNGSKACDEPVRVLLYGDSLTEGLLGNACMRHVSSRADRGHCFHPYALRVGERFERDHFAVGHEFLTSPPAELPKGRNGPAGELGCDGGAKSTAEVVEAGISGERVEHMVPRLKVLLKQRPRCFDVVVVLAGTNNLGSNQGRDEGASLMG